MAEEELSIHSGSTSHSGGRSASSRHSHGSQRSNLSTIIALKKAKAQAARVKVQYALKQASLQQEKTKIECNMKVLEAEAEFMAMEAEATELGQSLDAISISSEEIMDPMKKAAEFVTKHSQIDTCSETNVKKEIYDTEMSHEYPIEELQRPSLVPEVEPIHDLKMNIAHNEPKKEIKHEDPSKEIGRFLLRRELLMNRLTVFTDEAVKYPIWRKTFRSVINEIQIEPFEQIDLLVRYLGTQSKRFAESVRLSSECNPNKALSLIWERLDERYDSPELVEASIRQRIKDFPRLTDKDREKWYDLSDFLFEIVSIKDSPRYSELFRTYNTSIGVLPLVRKLPMRNQDRWITTVATYKMKYNSSFPPFEVFVRFVREISKIRNDPGLIFESNDYSDTTQSKFQPVTSRPNVTNKKTEVESIKCPIHNSDHTLNQCRAFSTKSMNDKKLYLKQNDICFRCCESNTHKQRDCEKDIQCDICKSNKHSTALHSSSWEDHGGETISKCTKICGASYMSKSCAKIVPVYVRNGDRSKKVYAILDEQSNHTLAHSDLLDAIGVSSQKIRYSLSTCAGTDTRYGRKATGLILQSMDKSAELTMNCVIECNQIPNERSEIPTACVADTHQHLQCIKNCIQPLDEEAQILLLIGRDLPEAHHIHDQKIGPPGTPYAQKCMFGWVVIGETCLGKVHKPEKLTVNKTYLLQNDQPSHFKPCTSQFMVKEKIELPDLINRDLMGQIDNIGSTIFDKSENDDKLAPSIEDRQFISLMERQFQKTPSGKWSAPLPFKVSRRKLPDNREYTLRRARVLVRNLRKNPTKSAHFIDFMKGLLENGHAEEAPPLTENEERWYLPLFGVYHPKKPESIRCVFDSSAKFEGISLNDVLISGPDLLNSLMGVLLRFRKEQVAIMCDIQQMFYSFLVDDTDRNYLRFFWHRDNNPAQELIEYRMTVHVFGNSSSPAVATYGLRRIANETENSFGQDVKEFISRNFYVDDGLKSVESEKEAIHLMKRSQQALKEGGDLVLHKIASNRKSVMESFPSNELSKDLKTIDLSSEEWPQQRSLGLVWSIKNDFFTFRVSKEEKPYTRRGVLSIINGIYDPLGFAAPVLIQGRLLMQDLLADGKDWDEPLPTKGLDKWKTWKESLFHLENLTVPRSVIPISLNKCSKKDLHIYCDASERAISAVAFIYSNSQCKSQYVGYIFGKSKVAPKLCNTIPRLELSAAVLAIEIYQTLTENLDINFDSVTFHTDSMIVLGYINNETKRFFTYVANRVQKIRKVTQPRQWLYVNSNANPADEATRGISSIKLQTSKWLSGPAKYPTSWKDICCEKYLMVDPDSDKEIRSALITKDTHISITGLGSSRFERFSSWERLVNVISILKHIGKSCKKNSVVPCKGWHLCKERRTVNSFCKAEQTIIQTVQSELFDSEINCSLRSDRLKKNSSISALNPFLDTDGLLKVGGRLRHANMSKAERHPVIIPKKSHIALLLIRYFHERVRHQGRQLTEGAIRSGGFWIIGAKRLIASLIHDCVKCRKLRGRFEEQKMADLPSDRVNFAAPFTYTGVDCFGPWTIVSRRTRGGLANSKRWAVLFTCLTIRAVHVEVVEDMSSSAFINALKRFTSIRGEVTEFRSDRGTNFIGAVNELNINTINVEDDPVNEYLLRSKTIWRFNPPYSSNMGGVWERMIRTIRSVLDSILQDHGCRNLTHDNLVTFMAEVCCIVNNRPIVPVFTDSQDTDLQILCPNMLLTQKGVICSESFVECDENVVYKAQWQNVQVLAERFWKRWKCHYLQSLQVRRKWVDAKPCIENGDFVLLKDRDVCRNDWPVGVVTNAIVSSDRKVRKVQLRIFKDGKPVTYTRSIRDLVLLLKNSN